MTQYNTLSVKLSNSELKLKSAIKNGTEVTSNCYIVPIFISSFTSKFDCKFL